VGFPLHVVLQGSVQNSGVVVHFTPPQLDSARCIKVLFWMRQPTHPLLNVSVGCERLRRRGRVDGLSFIYPALPRARSMHPLVVLL
jgi:hypothetical protein